MGSVFCSKFSYLRAKAIHLCTPPCSDSLLLAILPLITYALKLNVSQLEGTNSICFMFQGSISTAT